MNHTKNMAAEMNKKERLLSLDALRGFDMLFIMGLADLIQAFSRLWPGTETAEWMARQMEHVKWHGWVHHDTIFPLFLFIAGISFPFSLAKQRASKHTEKQITLKVVKRGLILVLLGMVYNGLFDWNFYDLRCASVLGRIGLAWMFAALLFMKFRPKMLTVISTVILIGYWLLLWLVPEGDDPFSFEHNLVGTIDRIMLPGKLIYGDNYFDPEGILSTFPAIVTALLGMLTGKFVKSPEKKTSGYKKSLYMLAAGIVLMLIGYLWDTVFPINKQLWTSSFVCVLAGYSLIMFALFYYIIDVKGYRRWTLFFRVIGMNSITIYLAQRIIDFQHISDFFVAGLAAKFPEVWENILNGCGYIAACWLFLYFLYRKQIFLKV